jgi:hypothetical protein
MVGVLWHGCLRPASVARALDLAVLSTLLTRAVEVFPLTSLYCNCLGPDLAHLPMIIYRATHGGMLRDTGNAQREISLIIAP